MRVFLLLGVAFFCVPVLSNDWRCRFAFAAVDGDEITDKIIFQSYGEIWSDLGEGISFEIFQTIIESGNPFLLPKKYQGDSSTLSDTLKEFENLVSEYGKNNATVRTELIEILKNSVRNRLQTVDKQAQQNKKKYLPLTPWPDNGRTPRLQFTASGKYLFGPGGVQGGLWISEDWKDFKKIDPILPESSDFMEFHLAPDGRHVFYTTRENNENVYRAQMFDAEGKLLEKWTPTLWFRVPKIQDQHETFKYLSHFHFSANGKWLLGLDGSELFVLSTQTPSSHAINPIFTAQSDSLGISKFLPFSDKLLVQDQRTLNFLNPEGQVAQTALSLRPPDESFKNADLNFKSQDFVITKDLTTAYGTFLQQGLKKVNLLTGEVSTLSLIQGTSIEQLFNTEIPGFSGLVLDPTEQYAFVILSFTKNPKTPPPGVLLTIDLKTGKTVKVSPLAFKNPSRIYLSPDGERVVVTYTFDRILSNHFLEEFLPN